MDVVIEIIHGDITEIEVDAIVNPANETLLGGGGADGMIHFKAGKGLLAECKTLNGCQKGEAKITKGYNLPAKHIIHTVGPVYGHEENNNEREILKKCYLNSLKLADEYKIKSIAFPCIGTGCYKFPKDEACQIAIDTTKEYLDNNQTNLEKVVFICYLELDFNVYKEYLMQ